MSEPIPHGPRNTPLPPPACESPHPQTPSEAPSSHSSPAGEFPTQVTLLLSAVGAGDNAAADRLMRTVHAELRRIAEAKLRNERHANDLQPTELINECFARVFRDPDAPPPKFENRAHFFAAAANAMRQFLVDNARKRKRLKRGGGESPAELHDAEAPMFGRDPDTVLDVESKMDELKRLDPLAAQVVEMRFHAFMTGDDIAAALGVSSRQVDVIWQHARAWLARGLE